MKKASVYILVAVLCLSVFAGCSRGNNSSGNDTPTPDPAVTASPDTIVPNTDGGANGNNSGMNNGGNGNNGSNGGNGANNALDDAANGVQNAVDDAANAVEDMMPDAEDGKITDGDNTENGTDAGKSTNQSGGRSR